ncbi:MAG TPA: tetratricopeptide repeat protein [Phototrophicaceae bacterium]|nr:tetratricopeptide repeat protein [Phototrophicaceae bacterium]
MRYFRLGILVAVFSWLSWAGMVTAQETFQPGDHIIVLPMVLSVRTAPTMDSPIVTDLWGGLATRVVALKTDDAGATWFYLENNAFGWVPEVLDGQPTLILYSEDTLIEMLAEATQTIETDPDNVDAYIRRGTVYFTQKRYAEAIADYEQAIALQPDDARLNEYAGIAYMDEGNDYAKAGDYFQKALDGGWRQAAAYRNLGLTYNFRFMYAEAGKYFQMAIEIAPKWGLLHDYLGHIAFRNRDFQQAQKYYTQALERDPYCIPAYIGHGWVAMQSGDYEAALDDYAKANSIDPFNGEVYVVRGLLYSEIYRDYDRALAEYNQAIEVDPDCDYAYQSRGYNYLATGKPELAVQDFKRALQLKPYNEDTRYNLATTYGKVGYYQDALANYTIVIDKVNNRRGKSALLYRAQIYIALGDYENALGDIDLHLKTAYLANNEQYYKTVAYLLRGSIELNRGDYATAIEDYQTAFDLQSEFATDYYSWGGGYRITQQRETLISELYGKIGADEDNADLYVQLGHVCMEFGRWSKALDAYQQALELQPNPDLQAFVDTFAELIQ